MAQLTQLILDGTFDAKTGDIRLYEAGRAIDSGFSIYSRAAGYYGDKIWNDELRPVQEDMANRFFRMPLDDFGIFEPRVESFENYNPTGILEMLGL